MLIDKTHIRWGLTSATVLLLATVGYIAYAINASPHPSGGTIVGLLFGIVASAMMIFAGLLAVRNRFPTVRCGSSQFWLRGHLWLGGLSLVFALFHSGFRFGSTLETTLMIAFIIVIASGLHGLAMQQVLPRLLTSRVPLETFGQQIPFICRRMQAESDMIVADVCGQLECDHDAINDAAYNLAVALGKLRNGKEGADFQKFLNATYTDGTSKKVPTSTVQATQVEVAATTAAATKTGDQTPADKSPKNKSGGGTAANREKSEDQPMSKVEMMRAAAKEKAKAKTAKPQKSPAESQPVKESVQRKTSPTPAPPEKAETPVATMTTEVISVACPNCEKQLVLPDRSYLGRIARCPQCTQKFVLGEVEESAQPETPSEQFESPAPESPAKIEQTEAGAAAEQKGKPEQSEAEDKPLSKIEQMRAQAARKRQQSEADEKPLSKVEQMRADAAKKREQQGNGDKPLSKVEQMRADAAKKRQLSESDDKPLSKVEQMRAAAAARKDAAKEGGGSPSKSSPASARKSPRPKPRPKKASVPAEPIPRADILKSFYLSSVRPYLSSERKQAIAMKSAVSPQMFAQTRNNLPPQLHDTLNQLQDFCEERRQFIVQKRLHWLLHSWLLVHVPASIALFVLFVVHVIVALRVIPWNP